MNTIKQLSVLLTIALFSLTANAQSEKVVEITAATSTPFLTEDERTEALISEDRPVLQSVVELDEQIKDSALDQKEASKDTERTEKLASSVGNRRQMIAKQTERRTLVSEVEVLQKPTAEKAPNKGIKNESKRGTDKEVINQKEKRIATLDNEITALKEQLTNDAQVIIDQDKAHKTELTQSLRQQADEKTERAQKINNLNSKLASETNQTKITRIEKQLANEQYRAAKLDARVVKLNEKTEKLDGVIERIQPDLVILPNTKN